MSQSHSDLLASASESEYLNESGTMRARHVSTNPSDVNCSTNSKMASYSKVSPSMMTCIPSTSSSRSFLFSSGRRRISLTSSSTRLGSLKSGIIFSTAQLQLVQNIGYCHKKKHYQKRYLTNRIRISFIVSLIQSSTTTSSHSKQMLQNSDLSVPRL